jgi:glycosyltransferase involved in cell wall biosynthesis
MWLLTGHCAYTFECKRWQTGCGQCPNLDIYPSIRRDATAINWRRKKRIYRQSRLYVTTVSQWLMQQVQESLLSGVQRRVILNAIDLSVFKPGTRSQSRAQLGLPATVKVVMFTGHSLFKDHEMMERACEQLQESSGNELLFICLGRADQGRALGQGHIVYPGFERDPMRLVSYYRSSDIFIHAAKGESFGKMIAEAMACGIPVVATSVGGIPELIDEELTGYLVPRGDSVHMAQRVQQLLDDPSLRHLMGQRAAAAAHSRFGLDRQVDEFLGWYKEIIEYEENANALSNSA